jgi:hypothetical protein
MKIKVIKGVFIMVGCLLVAVCWADGDLPKGFSSITKKHPGSTVVKITKGPKVVQVNMKTDASKADIYSFYKNELTGKGWMVGAENEPMLLLIKGPNQIVVSFLKSSGHKFDYSLTLFKNGTTP